MILEGTLMDIGIKNGNGWGVDGVGASDILASLPGVPLHLCEDRAHGCDYFPLTKSGVTIGKIMTARRVKNKIVISASVDHPHAEQMIKEGRLSRSWSIFAGYQAKNALGYLQKPRALGVSIVDTPAYPDAGYAAAALDDQLSELEKYYRSKWFHSYPGAGYAAAALDDQFTELDRYYRNKWQKPISMGSLRTATEASTAEKLQKALDRIERKEQPLTLSQALNKLEKRGAK